MKLTTESGASCAVQRGPDVDKLPRAEPIAESIVLAE